MSKFKAGDKVRVTGNSYYSDSDFMPERGSCLIGAVCEIKRWFPNSNTASIYTPDKSDWWMVRGADISSVSETPKEITLNGATYVLKEEPKPEHEWKFGDVAEHRGYGVGMVFQVPDAGNDVRFAYKGNWDWVDIKNLTFLRRADLSV